MVYMDMVEVFSLTNVTSHVALRGHDLPIVPDTRLPIVIRSVRGSSPAQEIQGFIEPSR